jgi:hypothetical protein
MRVGFNHAADIPQSARAACRSTLSLERRRTGSGVEGDGPIGTSRRFSNSSLSFGELRNNGRLPEIFILSIVI